MECHTWGVRLTAYPFFKKIYIYLKSRVTKTHTYTGLPSIGSLPKGPGQEPGARNFIQVPVWMAGPKDPDHHLLLPQAFWQEAGLEAEYLRLEPGTLIWDSSITGSGLYPQCQHHPSA